MKFSNLLRKTSSKDWRKLKCSQIFGNRESSLFMVNYILSRRSCFQKWFIPALFYVLPLTVIKEFNALVFHFLWNGKDKIIRRSTYAPYESGGLKMISYEKMVKALRLRCLKRVIDVDYTGFWKPYLNDLLRDLWGLFLLQWNYNIN